MQNQYLKSETSDWQSERS